MAFPPAFLDELRSRLPLSEVIGKRIRLTRAGREFKACCPFHNEKSASFYVNDDKQFFHCFGCGAHGDIIGFTMRHDRLSFPEAVESLAGLAGLQVPRDTPVEREKFDAEKRLYQVMERAAAWFSEQLFAPHGREALNYLRQRGLNEDCIRKFQLGFAPNDGQALIKKMTSEGFKLDELLTLGLARRNEERNEVYGFFRNRVMFPVGDRRGRAVAFGGRVMGEGEPKYLNSPDHPLFHKGKLLYGLSRARAAITQDQPIIVVEGYMDVITLVEAGFTGAVAPLGTALTEDQMIALWKCLPPLDARKNSINYDPIICFDGDNAGKRAATRTLERALPLLTPAHSLRIASIKKAKDPDDLIRNHGRAAMDAVLKEAKTIVNTIWDVTLEGRSMRTPEDHNAFKASWKHYTNLIGDQSLRKLYEDALNTEYWILKNQQAVEPRKTAGQDRGKFAKGGGKWRPPEPPSLVLSRRQPPDARTLREKALLALMINHPALFDEFGENLAQVGFQNPAFEGLRQRITDILSLDSHEPLDATELYRHLSSVDDAGFEAGPAGKALAEILSESTYMHAGFARPGKSIEQARQGWKSIWNKHLQEQLQAELVEANRRMDDVAVESLREQILSLETNMNGEGFSESA